MGKIVSIRCRRHKKRFNVELEWLNTSRWLCPRCYEKLTQHERIAYAPKGAEQVQVRDSEAGKPVVLPSKKHSSNRSKKCSNPNNKEATPISSADKKEIHKTKSTIESLKPEYVVHCKKCGDDYPCHSFWLKKSKVLCPVCAADMTEQQIRTFNIAHTSFIPETKRREETANQATSPTEHRVFPDSDAVEVGRCLPTRFIRTATVRELKDAVRKGKMSKIRAKIELRRRRKAAYYDDLPDDIF